MYLFMSNTSKCCKLYAMAWWWMVLFHYTLIWHPKIQHQVVKPESKEKKIKSHANSEILDTYTYIIGPYKPSVRITA